MQTMKKSKGMAVASFVFGLTFWIPLLNIIFGIFAIYFGVRALKNIKTYPKKFSGKWFAIAGITLAIMPITFYLLGLGLCMVGYEEICENMGLSLLI